MLFTAICTNILINIIYQLNNNTVFVNNISQNKKIVDRVSKEIEIRKTPTNVYIDL